MSHLNGENSSTQYYRICIHAHPQPYTDLLTHALSFPRRFRDENGDRVLITTDVLSRGIDVPQISLVRSALDLCIKWLNSASYAIRCFSGLGIVFRLIYSHYCAMHATLCLTHRPQVVCFDIPFKKVYVDRPNPPDHDTYLHRAGMLPSLSIRRFLLLLHRPHGSIWPPWHRHLTRR